MMARNRKLVAIALLASLATAIILHRQFVASDGISKRNCNLLKVATSSAAVVEILGRECDDQFELRKGTIIGGWSGTSIVKTWRGTKGYILVGFDDDLLVTGAGFQPVEKGSFDTLFSFIERIFVGLLE